MGGRGAKSSGGKGRKAKKLVVVAVRLAPERCRKVQRQS